MLASLTDFAEELRTMGIPVSMVEVIDAASALEHTDLKDPANLRATLGATLIKNARHYRAFDAAFDVFFGLAVRPDAAEFEPDGEISRGLAGAGDGSSASDDMLSGLVDALTRNDRDQLRMLISRAVTLYAGMQPGRPVGGRYYTYRVLKRIDSDALLARLLAAIAVPALDSELDARLRRDEAEAMLQDRKSVV
jgi:hypothetical protein